MLAPMKKHPTKAEIHVYGDQAWKFVGPKRKLKLLLTLLPEFEFKSVPAKRSGKPWQKVAQDRIAQYGEPGLALRGARAKMGLSQVALGEKVGVAQNEISKMEHGKRTISKKMALKLAKALSTDYRVFL